MHKGIVEKRRGGENVIMKKLIHFSFKFIAVNFLTSFFIRSSFA